MTIWFNVSTSAHWRRPPLGIVRVERRLAQELRLALGPSHLRFCVWDKDLDLFLAWDETLPEVSQGSPGVQSGFDPLGSAPRGGRMEALRSIGREIAGLLPDRARRPMARVGHALETVVIGFRRSVRRAAARRRLGLNRQPPAFSVRSHCLARGDVLITVGLDWETGFPSVLAEIKSQIGFSVIGFCHDLIPIKYPQLTPVAVSAVFADYLRQLASYCDAIACVSKCTQADLREVLRTLGLTSPPLIRVRLGTDISGDAGSPSGAVSAVLAEPFILYVSTIERRKNHEVLYQAMHRLAERHDPTRVPRFVFVGSLGWGVSDLLHQITMDPLTRRKILLLHNVSDSDLGVLYREALFCVFPSLYEGWGIPVAEALSFGKPMICSDRGSVPEVGRDLVEYVDPWDLPGWVRMIERLWLNDAFRAQRVARIRSEYRVDTWTGAARPVADTALALESRPPGHLDMT